MRRQRWCAVVSGLPLWMLLVLAGAVAPVQAQITVADGNWRNRIQPAARYDEGEVIERLATADGRFAIHFSRAGRNAVPARDSDGDGQPDMLRAVADTLMAAQAVYTSRLAMRPPLGSLDNPQAALDVFLADFGGRGDGAFIQERCRTESPKACAGLLLLENDFAGYPYGSPEIAARIVASHELFHAVQAAYDKDASQVVSEGTATLATELFDPSLNDFERAITAYLAAPDQPLGINPTTPASPFGYGSALFFRYLNERHGGAVLREIYERTEKQPPSTVAGLPRWLSATAEFLEARGTSFAAAFAEFARWNAVTGPRATKQPEYAGYPEAASYPKVNAVESPLPLAELSVRISPGAARYYSFRPEGRTRLTATVAGGPVGAALELMVLYEDQEGGHVIGRAPRTLGFDVPAGAARLLVSVSNAGLGGNSSRVGICVGSEAEAAACAAMVTPTPVSVDAGADGAAPAAGDGGGCSVAAWGARPGDARTPSPGLLLLAVTLALLSRGHRRRPAHSGRTGTQMSQRKLPVA